LRASKRGQLGGRHACMHSYTGPLAVHRPIKRSNLVHRASWGGQVAPSSCTRCLWLAALRQRAGACARPARCSQRSAARDSGDGKQGKPSAGAAGAASQGGLTRLPFAAQTGSPALPANPTEAPSGCPAWAPPQAAPPPGRCPLCAEPARTAPGVRRMVMASGVAHSSQGDDNSGAGPGTRGECRWVFMAAWWASRHASVQEEARQAHPGISRQRSAHLQLGQLCHRWRQLHQAVAADAEEGEAAQRAQRIPVSGCHVSVAVEAVVQVQHPQAGQSRDLRAPQDQTEPGAEV
jgi:hypothetical protein